jgi:anti-sigma regulatory factor (Ser/Thr protein kinase)
MTADPPGPERREFEAVPASAHEARRFVTDLLHLDGAPAEVISDCSLVVSELVTNVIEHSGGQRVEVAVDLADLQWWRLEVVGAAPIAPKQLAPPETWTVGGANDLSGRGLGIVRQLMDDVVITATNGWISVTCRRRRPEGH